MYSFQAHPQPRIVADSLQESEIKKYSKYILELRRKKSIAVQKFERKIDAHFQKPGKLTIPSII